MEGNVDNLLEELQQRWQQLFTALARGEDVAPSARLRAEGMMEAAVLVGAADPVALDALLEATSQATRGSSLADELGADWRSFYPFPQLPLYMGRAPVVPSTSD
ncbi:hypothetical protein BST95_00745 [Halioglobus japonicus]|uniref:Uncharacterized protein n=1 Tax=Halioglobus japonicus TaxID=930805 RepID=A0AAP8MBQ3_9GAMM|nr:hypothetical protein BST95_00745 [Halioglobus japonicus]PLW84853.1 hypothetical protein C0029_17810 [Halioglobus japonicus]